MRRGYIKVFRSLQDNPLWLAEPFTKAQAWIDILMLTSHRKTTKIVRGIPITVKRGQLAWSTRSLADRWGWSRGRVLRFFDKLEEEDQVKPQKNNVTTLYTVTNYEKYQVDGTTGSTTESAPRGTTNRTTNSTTDGTTKKSVLPSDYEEYDGWPLLDGTTDRTPDGTTDGTTESPANGTKENKEYIGNIEKKKKPPKGGKEKEKLPEFVPADLWKDFIQMRNKIKKPMTDRAKVLALKQLEKLHEEGHDITVVMEQSIFKCWQSFYAPKDDADRGSKGQLFGDYNPLGKADKIGRGAR
jgi:hypothetical protein